jgi:hypothetical protein
MFAPMSLPALRRWFARHPTQWVLGVGLGLVFVLCGAQLAAAVHQISHVAAPLEAGNASAHGTHDRQGTHDTDGTRDLRVADNHDCPTCLLAAALGGAATAPVTVVFHAPDTLVSAPRHIARGFTPRLALPYASRAPPASPVAAA